MRHLTSEQLEVEVVPTLVSAYFLIDAGKFHYLKFILEGYDNLAILSAIDRKNGVVRIMTTRALYPELMTVLSSIAVHLKKNSL